MSGDDDGESNDSTSPSGTYDDTRFMPPVRSCLRTLLFGAVRLNVGASILRCDVKSIGS